MIVQRTASRSFSSGRKRSYKSLVTAAVTTNKAINNRTEAIDCRNMTFVTNELLGSWFIRVYDKTGNHKFTKSFSLLDQIVGISLRAVICCAGTGASVVCKAARQVYCALQCMQSFRLHGPARSWRKCCAQG